MRSKPIELLTSYQRLVGDLLNQLPKAKGAELRSRADSLNAEAERFKRDGRGGHWKRYRDEQAFEVAIRGKGAYTVQGVDRMAAELGWKVSTLRSRLATGRGVTSFERENAGEPELVTITRLRSAE